MKSQLDYYKECQQELLKRHEGKIIALVDGMVLGEFSTKTDALEKISKEHAPGTYLIIKCTQGDEEYTRRFRSRVILPEQAYA